MSWLAFLAENALRSAVVLAAAFAAAAALRHASAALRSLVWTSAFAVLLALPAAMLVVPKWDPLPARAAGAYAVLSSPPAAMPAPISKSALPASPTRKPNLAWIAAIWALGCAAVAARFLLCFWNASRLVRRGLPAGYARASLENARLTLGMRRRARVLESSGAPMPLAWGVFEPTVILPLGAGDWPEGRLRAVLLHELAHAQRLDLAAQAAAQAACCLYWFHPLAWVAARQFYKERELACDDAVLSHVSASEYAVQLVEVARSMAGQRLRWAGAPAMARSSDLEARVRALLDRHRDRRPLTWRAASATAALACAVLLPAAAFTARAQPARPESASAAAPAPAPSPSAQPLPEPEPKAAAEPQSESGTIYGAVRDPSNSVVPNCGVSARNLDANRTETAVTNAAGGYRLAVPPGRYALEVRAPGFAIARREVVVAAGLSTQADIDLELGHLTEEINVTARKPAAAAPASPAAASAAPQGVKSGGNVQTCKLIRMVRPAYPEDLRLAGIEGTVVVRAIISKDGDVLNPQATSADIDARLVEAAVAAVRQWKYSPTLLNGQPVETLTQIAVAFSLQ